MRSPSNLAVPEQIAPQGDMWHLSPRGRAAGGPEMGRNGLHRIGDEALDPDVDMPPEPESGREATRFGGLLGASPEMRELFATLERIAPTPLTVLAQGEPGTGKETLARALHARSPRRAAPFVVLDAVQAPGVLAESVLFGHERGAFAGAHARHLGVLERAQGGTIFLDEVGDLPLDLQPKLLRALEKRSFSRVGGTEVLAVDVRFVAATRRDLRAEIDAHRFREDLYYRLAEAPVLLPPLRARPADVPLLTRHFLDELATPERPLSLAPEALDVLLARRWPGNAHELRNVLARSAAQCETGVITAADLIGERLVGGVPEIESLDLGGTFAEAKARAVERFERAYLEAMLRRCGGNLSKAARQADIARNHMRELLKKRGLYEPGGT